MTNLIVFHSLAFAFGVPVAVKMFVNPSGSISIYGIPTGSDLSFPLKYSVLLKWLTLLIVTSVVPSGKSAMFSPFMKNAKASLYSEFTYS